MVMEERGHEKGGEEKDIGNTIPMDLDGHEEGGGDDLTPMDWDSEGFSMASLRGLWKC